MEPELLQAIAITPTEAKAVIVNTKEDFINAGDVLKFIKDKIKKTKQINQIDKPTQKTKQSIKDLQKVRFQSMELQDKIMNDIIIQEPQGKNLNTNNSNNFADNTIQKVFEMDNNFSPKMINSTLLPSQPEFFSDEEDSFIQFSPNKTIYEKGL